MSPFQAIPCVSVKIGAYKKQLHAIQSRKLSDIYFTVGGWSAPPPLPTYLFVPPPWLCKQSDPCQWRESTTIATYTRAHAAVAAAVCLFNGHPKHEK